MIEFESRHIICPVCKKFEVQILEGACDIETVKCDKCGHKIVVVKNDSSI